MMKSIKSKIMFSMITTVVISLILVGGIACILGYHGTNVTLEASMKKVAAVAADRVSYELQAYKNIANEVGTVIRLSDPAISVEEKKSVLQEKANTYGFTRYNLLDLNGVSLFNGQNYSDRTYFQQSKDGKVYVSEPLLSNITNEATIVVSAPIWENGKPNSKVVGVLCFIPKETFLSDIMSSLEISKNGSAYMLDMNGTTIAHKDLDIVRSQDNIIAKAQSDKSLSSLAGIQQNMIQGSAGFGTYRFDGMKKFTAYAPVKDTNGWSIAVNAPVADFISTAMLALFITIVMVIITAIIASFIAIRLAMKIGKPMQDCSARLKLLAEGDLDTPVPNYESQDEVGELVNSTHVIVNSLRFMLKDIDYLLEEMGNGNFVIESQTKEYYVGDFYPLLVSIQKIKNKLSDVLLQIRTSAEQISSGAEQISNGAQALAQGATEQASSVQELVNTVTQIADEAQKTVANTDDSKKHAELAGAQVHNSNAQMQDMTLAMAEITQSSEKISHIIGTIEDIAFQTNILALNAAVEAARAGSAGKGFAVVADEVRNLASKSDEAAKATKELIENSIKTVEKGSNIVDSVTKSLHKTTELAVLAVSDMGKVASAVEQEANKISHITEGLEQISSVVQTNSATSEQSAAASEELASQSQLLKDMVNQFQLPNSNV